MIYSCFIGCSDQTLMGLSTLFTVVIMACLQCKCVCFDRMFGDGMIPLPHIYGARIKGVEVFCPLDPPPPYEAVASQPAAQVLNHIVIICHLLSHNHICQKALSIYSIYS